MTDRVTPREGDAGEEVPAGRRARLRIVGAVEWPEHEAPEVSAAFASVDSRIEQMRAGDTGREPVPHTSRHAERSRPTSPTEGPTDD